jgi:co-chaperonin GroES (HSP10)
MQQRNETGAGLGEAFDLGNGERLRLAGDNILVLMDHHRDVREMRTAGGLYVPQQARPGAAEAVWATVISCGRGTLREPMPCKAGDRVLVDSAMQGDRYEIGGVECRVIRQANLMAVDDGA